jgi:hypothetical protein
MTFSGPQIIRAKAEASIEQAQTAFWFPVLPGLQALPSTPTITTNPTPAPANAVPVPVGFNQDNPDLADLFANILPKGVAPVHPKTMAPAAGLIVPPYNEIQTWQARIRVPAEATLLPFSNEIVYAAAETLKVRVPTVVVDRLGESTRALAITGTAAGVVFTPPIVGTSIMTLAIAGTAAGVVLTPPGSTATFAIAGTATGTVRVAGASSATLAITGTAAGTVAAGPVTGISSVTLAITGRAADSTLLTATISQSSTYFSGGMDSGTFAVMTNGNYNETRQTGTNTSADQWIRMDFGSVQNYSRILVGHDLNTTLDGGQWGPGYADDKVLQKSDDGTSWTTIQASTGSFAGVQYKVFNVGAQSSRYVRIYNGGSGYIAVTEFYALQPA